jgi:hypothetical protein
MTTSAISSNTSYVSWTSLAECSSAKASVCSITSSSTAFSIEDSDAPSSSSWATTSLTSSTNSVAASTRSVAVSTAASASSYWAYTSYWTISAWISSRTEPALHDSSSLTSKFSRVSVSWSTIAGSTWRSSRLPIVSAITSWTYSLRDELSSPTKSPCSKMSSANCSTTVTTSVP